MKTHCLLVLVIFLTYGCKTQDKIFTEGKTYKNFRGFTPVDPVEYDDKVVLKVDDKLISKEIKLLNNDEILQFLNNETVLVSIGQVQADGKISYLPITISAKYESYKVTMDYMKFATLAQFDGDGNYIGFNRVGVGLRLITLLTTTEAGINIGDLSSIGLAAKAGKVKGTLMIEVVGIKSKDVTTLLPLPSEINQTTIQNAMQALASIKSKIYDADTRLFPQVMAIKSDSTIIPKQAEIGQDSIDLAPVLKNKAINELILQVGSSKLPSTSKVEQAKKYESEAFKYLFEQDIESALVSLSICENIYPGYHSIHEIKNLLQADKSNLLDPKSSKWKYVYQQILEKYSWRLSDEILDVLKERVK